ncbi:MAG: helix-turn-helix domain-containing protein [Rhodoglobus sp.]|nr:helix-turn-helix domain-containing protein [Rhodoglobus sp.]
MTDPAPRNLRADAERNRVAIIGAAAQVLADEGTGVTLEHIAAVAGVGVGTIYRRFASIDHLVAVVFEEKMTDYARRSEAAAEAALTDPLGAFDDYVFYILEQQATDIAFSDVILNPRRGTELFREQMKRALVASEILVERARSAGVIRSDFDHSDLYMLIHANSGLVKGTKRSAPRAWRRFGEYMLEAFHREGQRLTPPSAVLTRARERK